MKLESTMMMLMTEKQGGDTHTHTSMRSQMLTKVTEIKQAYYILSANGRMGEVSIELLRKWLNQLFVGEMLEEKIIEAREQVLTIHVDLSGCLFFKTKSIRSKRYNNRHALDLQILITMRTKNRLYITVEQSDHLTFSLSLSLCVCMSRILFLFFFFFFSLLKYSLHTHEQGHISGWTKSNLLARYRLE